MNPARCLTVFFTVSLALALTARADMQSDYEQREAAAEAAGHDPDIGPMPETTARPDSDDAQTAAKKRQAKAAKDDADNWLVNAYERQLEAHATADGQSDNNNLYARIAADPELAKLAGISPIASDTDSATGSDVSNSSKALDLRTGLNSGNSGLTLRPDSSLRDPSNPAPAVTAFRPLITPLGETEAAGLHNFYGDIGASSSSDSSAAITPIEDDRDAGMLDTPGMTAAASNPNLSTEEDFTLGLLPGETPGEQKEHHDLSLELPVAGNAQRLQKQDMAALTVPGQKPKTVVPASINPVPVKPPPSDTAEMVPDVSPIRARVDDPFDILNR
jgi:hypothetical protein